MRELYAQLYDKVSFRLRQECVLADGSASYVGNYSLTSCEETQSRVRWQRLAEDNTRRADTEECVSESQTRSRTVTVDGPGDFSPWIGVNVSSNGGLINGEYSIFDTALHIETAILVHRRKGQTKRGLFSMKM